MWENVALGLRDGARKRAHTALAEVDLLHRADAWPLTLSGGEAQRGGLARALVREPQFLLLDEPFASIDALTRLKMHELVLALWRLRHVLEPDRAMNATELPRCEFCAHLDNAPETLENAIPGLRSLSSGFAAVRDRDGLCSLHERYLPPALDAPITKPR